MQKIAILTHACRLAVASLLFVFVVHRAGVERATYLHLDWTSNVNKTWNISFIIHVNFNHAWTENYPVNLSLELADWDGLGTHKQTSAISLKQAGLPHPPENSPPLQQ